MLYTIAENSECRFGSSSKFLSFHINETWPLNQLDITFYNNNVKCLSVQHLALLLRPQHQILQMLWAVVCGFCPFLETIMFYSLQVTHTVINAIQSRQDAQFFLMWYPYLELFSWAPLGLKKKTSKCGHGNRTSYLHAASNAVGCSSKYNINEHPF